jgi:hypothetical protein
MQGKTGTFQSEYRKANDKLRVLGVDGSKKLKRLLKTQGETLWKGKQAPAASSHDQ